MAHSEKANERRREFYRQGRLLGLSPRDAGHLYSERGIERAEKGEVRAKTERQEGTARQRQERYAQLVSAKLGRELTVEESEYRYRVHNYARRYLKAELTIEGSDGELHRRTVTLTSDRPLSREEARDRVLAYVEKGNVAPQRTGTDRGTLVSVSFEETVLYPDLQL